MNARHIVTGALPWLLAAAGATAVLSARRVGAAAERWVLARIDIREIRLDQAAGDPE